jgi:hypothetical protein
MKRHGKQPKSKALILCACGCGKYLPPQDRYGRQRQYINHHNVYNMPIALKKVPHPAQKGKPLLPEHRQHISEGLLKAERRGRPPQHR